MVVTLLAAVLFLAQTYAINEQFEIQLAFAGCYHSQVPLAVGVVLTLGRLPRNTRAVELGFIQVFIWIAV